MRAKALKRYMAKKREQVEKKAERVIADIWDRLITAQEAYYAKHGKYFQLLIEPQEKVVDGEDKDFSSRKPRDEKHENDVTFNAGTKLPFQLEIHEHVSKEGAGFTMIARSNIDGVDYEFSKGHGAGSKSHGWKEAIEPEIKEEVEEKPERPIPPINIPPIDNGNATSTPSTI